MHHVCIMNTSEMYHRCNILKRDYEQYSLKVKIPVFEDKGIYTGIRRLNENDSVHSNYMNL